MENLDKNRILLLLADADAKWYADHVGKFEYREHLDFVADYIAKNYHKKQQGGKR